MTDLLEIEKLSVSLKAQAGRVRALNAIDLTIAPGETVCLVGESGSGKTVTAMSVMRLIDHKGGKITEGEIRFGGRDLARLSQRQMSDLRGRHIGIVFQEPMTAFDPLFTIGAQIIEVIRRHSDAGPTTARQRAIALLDRVRIPDPHLRLEQYPHELSGGMRQRAMIAMALACEPRLLIADEPTTALDVTIQAQILDLLKELQAANGMAILLITHDLGIAATIADRVVVLYAGDIAEVAPGSDLFSRPMHPYTRGLLGSIVSGTQPRGSRLPAIDGSIPDLAERSNGCSFRARCPRATRQCELAAPPLERRGTTEVACWHPHVGVWAPATISAETAPRVETGASTILRADDLHKHYRLRGRGSGPHERVVRAVDGVSFEVRAGETFGLVGESGSGKSTLGRLLLHLEKPTGGRVEFEGRDLAKLRGGDLRKVRRNMQMIFQDPHGSLDPRWTIGAAIGEPLSIHERLTAHEQTHRVRDLLELVGLDPRWDTRFPHQLSGGQRQRVSIARAIALNPRLIIADEAVSALDVSVRAQIVNLLQELRERLALTYVFIGHDLNLVRHISDRIGVMYSGRLVEVGEADALFSRAAHPYTKALLAAIPEPDPTRRRTATAPVGEATVPTGATGCAFQNRCGSATERCREENPFLRPIAVEHAVACHHPH
jgi:peptide/nickel transport system ATP-binding protein